MENRTRKNRQPSPAAALSAAASSAAAQPPAAPGTPPAFKEPEVRRWPHPINGRPVESSCESTPVQEATLYYIRCALSYQNQQLADIKALLQQLAGEAEEPEGK